MAVVVPQKYKGYQPSGDRVPGAWWYFKDARLNHLINAVDCQNFQLKATVARIRQSEALIKARQSLGVPQVDGSAGFERERNSQNETSGPETPINFNRIQAGLSFGWELDLWDRIAYEVEAAEADAELLRQFKKDLALSIKWRVARNYFAIRFIDKEKKVIQDSINERAKNVKLAKELLDAGVVSELDGARARSELARSKALLASLDGPRANFVNATAVLIGRSASQFTIPPIKNYKATLPKIDPGLPINVVSERPDIRASIEEIRAAHARVGVAKAEFFPRVSLLGDVGLGSISASDFLNWSSRSLTIGPTVNVPVFQGGRLKANRERAIALVDELVNDFQHITLQAFRDVENSLANLKAASKELKHQNDALVAAGEAKKITNLRYAEGFANSNEIIAALRDHLFVSRRVVQLESDQFEATVFLIRSLGGASLKATK